MTFTRHGHLEMAKNDLGSICIINPFDFIWLAGIIKLFDFYSEKAYFENKNSKMNAMQCIMIS